MTSWLPKSDPDRVESLKAAVLAGAAAGLVAALELALRRLMALGLATGANSLFLGLAAGAFWVNVAIATLSGSLFGITYRYAIRQDGNPQINQGVILAFALVRGLALVDTAAALSLRGWPFLTATLESLALFATAGLALELAFRLKWVARVGRD